MKRQHSLLQRILRRILWKRVVAEAERRANYARREKEEALADSRHYKMMYDENYQYLTEAHQVIRKQERTMDELRRRISILAREKERLMKPKLPR